MPNFVQDQKGFELGQVSLAVTAKLSRREYFSSLRKLENFDVNKDSSVSPRKSLRVKQEKSQNAVKSWPFEDVLFTKKADGLYFTRNNVEILLSFPRGVDPYHNLSIPDAATVREIKKIEDKYYIFFENAIPYKFELTNTGHLIYPFFQNSPTDTNKAQEKFPFSGLFYKFNHLSMSFEFTDTTLGTLRLTLKEGELPEDLRFVPVLINLKTDEYDLDAIKVVADDAVTQGDTTRATSQIIGDRAGFLSLYNQANGASHASFATASDISNEMENIPYTEFVDKYFDSDGSELTETAYNAKTNSNPFTANPYTPQHREDIFYNYLNGVRIYQKTIQTGDADTPWIYLFTYSRTARGNVYGTLVGYGFPGPLSASSSQTIISFTEQSDSAINTNSLRETFFAERGVNYGSDINTGLASDIDAWRTANQEQYTNLRLRQRLGISTSKVSETRDNYILKRGNQVDQKYVFKTFQSLADRFYLLIPYQRNSETEYLCGFISIGDNALDRVLNQQHEVNNFFISDFYPDNYPIDALNLNGKTFFISKKGSLFSSEFEEPDKLSNPIKSLINNRILDNLSYNNIVFPGTSKRYMSRGTGPSDYYREFLDTANREGLTLNLSDPLAFKLNNPEGTGFSIYHFLIAPTEVTDRGGAKIFVFTSDGIYQFLFNTTNSNFIKVSNFVVDEEVKPELVQNYVFCVSKDNEVYSFKVSGGNNANLELVLADEYYNGLFDTIKCVCSFDQTSLFVLTESKLWRFNVMQGRLFGNSEYTLEDEIFKYLHPNGLFETEEDFFEFNGNGDEFDAIGSLQPFTVSRFLPEHGLYFPRTVETIVPIGKSTGLEVGKDYRDYRSAKVFNADDEIYRANYMLPGFRYGDCLCFKRKSSVTDKLYGFSLTGTYKEN